MKPFFISAASSGFLTFIARPSGDDGRSLALGDTYYSSSLYFDADDVSMILFYYNTGISFKQIFSNLRKGENFEMNNHSFHE